MADAAPRRTWRPYVAVLAAATMWGTIGTSYELLLDRVETDRLTAVTLRALVATLLLCGWLAFRDPAAFRVRRADLPRLALLGLVSVTVFYPALIYTFARTSVAVGTLLLYTAPALVTLGAAAFLREPLTRGKLFALALAFAGAALVVGAYRPGNLGAKPAGIALGLLAAASYGAYSLLAKPLLARYRPPTVVVWHLLFGTAGLLALKAALAPTAWPDPPGALLVGGYNGVVTTLLPIVLYTAGLRGLPAAEASILATWEPVVAVLLAAAFLNESLPPPQAAGALLVLSSALTLAAQGFTSPFPRRKRGTPAPVKGGRPSPPLPNSGTRRGEGTGR